MSATPGREAIGRLLAQVEIGVQRQREAEASGWVVVVVDTESDSIVSAYGPEETPEAALAVAGRFDADPHTGVAPADGEPGWRHFVVPLFAVVLETP